MATDTFGDLIQNTSTLGLIGDTHADLGFTLRAMSALQLRGATVAVVAGDFGFVWGSARSGVEALSAAAAHLDTQLLFVDGNHEDFHALYEHPIGQDGIRWIAPRVGHVPRATRLQASGIQIAFMGGANSIDRWRRRPNVSWWEGEQITAENLEALGTEHAEVLIGHDAPEPLPLLDQHLWTTKRYWTMGELAYAAEGRKQYTRAFRAVRPRLVVAGHYHHHVSQVVRVDDEAGGFESRIVVLDMNEGSGPNCGVLQLPSLFVEVFHV